MITRVSRQQIQAVTADRPPGMATGDVDEMAIPSYLHANPLIRWLMWRRHEAIAAMAGRDRLDSALEFGCGAGVFLPQMHHIARTVYAIDLFPEFARRLDAKLALGTRFIDDVGELEDGCLDLIIAADVLEHIEDLPPWLELFASKLRRGGRLIVSGPTENVFYRMGRWLAGFGDKGHYHHTDIDQLFAAITQYGFRSARSRNLPFYLPPHLFRVCQFYRPG